MIRAELSPRELVTGRETDLAMVFVNSGPGTCSNLIFKLVLPRQIVLVGGSDRVEIRSLPPGEVVTRTVRVRPLEPGPCVVSSTNFSYRDRRGIGQRVEGFEVAFTVQPRVPEAPAVVAEPELVLSLPTASLPHLDWQTLHGRVENVGGSPIHQASVSVSGQFEIDARSRRQEIDTIDPGQTAEFTCHVRAAHRGDVPVYLDVVFRDETGLPRRVERTFTVSVGGKNTTPTTTAGMRILYLAASPFDADRTRWEEGFREIEDACLRSKNASMFELVSRFAVRDRDIGQALVDVAPHVVQFSGHGLEGGLYVESTSRRRQPITADGLVQLFGAVGESVDCVVLGACHTKSLAQDLAERVNHTIGMDGEIESRSMINFSIGFYQALAAGLSVAKAFDAGRAHIAMQAHNNEDQFVPRLFTSGHSGT